MAAVATTQRRYRDRPAWAGMTAPMLLERLREPEVRMLRILYESRILTRGQLAEVGYEGSTRQVVLGRLWQMQTGRILRDVTTRYEGLGGIGTRRGSVLTLGRVGLQVVMGTDDAMEGWSRQLPSGGRVLHQLRVGDSLIALTRFLPSLEIGALHQYGHTTQVRFAVEAGGEERYMPDWACLERGDGGREVLILGEVDMASETLRTIRAKGNKLSRWLKAGAPGDLVVWLISYGALGSGTSAGAKRIAGMADHLGLPLVERLVAAHGAGRAGVAVFVGGERESAAAVAEYVRHHTSVSPRPLPEGVRETLAGPRGWGRVDATWSPRRDLWVVGLGDQHAVVLLDLRYRAGGGALLVDARQRAEAAMRDMEVAHGRRLLWPVILVGDGQDRTLPVAAVGGVQAITPALLRAGMALFPTRTGWAARPSLSGPDTGPEEVSR